MSKKELEQEFLALENEIKKLEDSLKEMRIPIKNTQTKQERIADER